MANRVFRMVTISKDLEALYPPNVDKVRLFNFTEGQIDLTVAGQNFKPLIGTLENVWIRVFDTSSKYTDFIASSIYFDVNARGVFLLASEDTEHISVEKISEMVKNYLNELQSRNVDTDRYLNTYATSVLKEIKVATKELASLHSVVKINAFSRLDIEDTFEYGRDLLMRRYLLNLIASKIIKENRDQVLELLS